jgi:hypothetical protein
MFRRSNKVTETNIATATSNNSNNNNNSQHNRTISTSTSSNSHVLNTTSNLYHRCWNLILSYNSSSIIIVGLLVYGVLFQLLILRSKDETIATLTQQYTKINNLQHRFATFRNDCSQVNTSGATTTTTNNATSSTSTNNTGNIIHLPNHHGVGVFPIRKPIIDNSTIPKTIPIWKPFSTTVLSKVSYPIFVTSLPKSGTTSIWKYFKCGHQLSCHNWIQKIDDNKSSIAGICIEDNIVHQRPPFENCGRYDVYTDTGVRSCLLFSILGWNI